MAQAEKLSETLAAMHGTNPWPRVPVLQAAMNYLMTELWDRGFSQTEIREAFESAVLDLPGYAAGEERNQVCHNPMQL